MFSFSTVLICPCIEFSYIKAAYMFLLKKKSSFCVPLHKHVPLLFFVCVCVVCFCIDIYGIMCVYVRKASSIYQCVFYSIER